MPAVDAHGEIVKRFEAAQGEPGFAWDRGPSGVEHAVVDGVTFIPSHIEQSVRETRHTPASRLATFLLPLSLSAFYGAYSLWGDHPPWPGVLLVCGITALALGVWAARSSSRADAGRSRTAVHRKGLYLSDGGALVVQGVATDDDDLRFYPRASIEGVTYSRSGRTSRTRLVLRDVGPVFAHALDVRPIVEAWLARGK